MNKNIKALPKGIAFHIPIQNAPRLSGWAVQYISGLDDEEIKTGFWLAVWSIIGSEATLRFEPEMHMCYRDEQEAIEVSKLLRENAEIETEVVKVG